MKIQKSSDKRKAKVSKMEKKTPYNNKNRRKMELRFKIISKLENVTTHTQKNKIKNKKKITTTSKQTKNKAKK